ncbi:MAG: hypothetical protein WC455_18920 [Dehalococcoidia bacterium]|jgi:hypothetical protein
MPTGYTAVIGEKDITFKEFALLCARAFGACVMQRDDPMDQSPKLQQPSDFYAKEIEKVKRELGALEDMTIAQAEVRAAQECAETIDRAQTGIAKDAALWDKYEAMLVQVKAWKPPTPDHEELKKFMAEQIVGSMDFDCMGTYYRDKIANAKQLTGEAWLLKERTRLTKDIARDTEEYEREVQRTNERNAWITALWGSL